MQLRFSGRLNLTHATRSMISKATVSDSARSGVTGVSLAIAVL